MLYQKYRPKTFTEMVGNQEEIKSLTKIFSTPDHPHVLLLIGSPGTGKTTTARILASMLGAEEINVFEYNVSNNRGIDTAREIIENLGHISFNGKPNIYILDEVHKQTNEFANAMLKPLEDTPSNTYFFLCTTDPAKLLPALRTRCTEVKFKPLNEAEILTLLRRVKKEENKTISVDVLESIAEFSEGSARKALVLLEKAFSLSTEEEQLSVISKDDEKTQAIELCRLLLKHASWKEISTCIQALDTTEWEGVRYTIMNYMSSVLLKNPTDAVAAILDCFTDSYYTSGKAGLVLSCYAAIRGR